METLESLARVCASKGLSSETWFRLFEGSHASTDQNEALKLAIDSVLILILPLHALGKLESLGDAPFSCLSLCCSKSEAARHHLLQCLLERASAGLITIALAVYEVGSRFNAVSRILLSSGGPLPTASDIDLGAVLRLLRLAFMHGLSPLVDLAGYLLAMPNSRTGKNLHSTNRDDLKAVYAQLASDKAKAFGPQQIELVRQGIYALEATVLPGALLTDDNDDSGIKTQYSMPVEMELILQQCLRASPDSHKLLQGSYRARVAFLRSRQVHDEMAVTSWLKDLFSCLKLHVVHWPGSPKGRDEARWKAFGLAVIPRVLSSILNVSKMCASHRSLQVALDILDASGCKDLLDRLKAGVQGNFTEPDFEAPKSSPDGLAAALAEIVYSYEYHHGAAMLMRDRMHDWIKASDLPSLASFLRALVAEGAILGDSLSLHVDFGSVLDEVCCLLDSTDCVSDYGAGSGMELFGNLLLSLQTLCYRHSLHLASGAVANVVRNPSSMGTARSLASLSQQHKSLVSLWITALHGNEGIDDDLLRSTGPMTFLGLAPTIVEQSMQAWQMGVIDTDNLLGGLSYFTQDLLSFSLPGIIAYLAGRHHNFAGSLLVLKSLLSMESTPACVLELVAGGLHTFLDSSEASFPAQTADISILKSRIEDRSSLRMDSETLSRALHGTGSLLQNWQGAVRLQSSSELAQICVQQEPILASALLVAAPAKQIPSLIFALQSKGHQVETVALVVLRIGCQVPGDAAFKNSLEAWCKAYAEESIL